MKYIYTLGAILLGSVLIINSVNLFSQGRFGGSRMGMMGMRNSQVSTRAVTTTENPRGAMMREHCKIMPEMPGCEKYIQSGVTLYSTGSSLNTSILTDDATTKNEVPSPIVNLKNGDTYDITVEKVRKMINGKSLVMLSYNESIPGPTIRVAKGSTVTLKLHNTVAGLETTIHPHGLRLENQYDGVPRDQGGFQDPIKIGDVYEQKLSFPDTGIYWYHPHTRDDFEQELGEYGTFLVYDPSEKQVYDSESVIVLDDILLNAAGNVENFSKDVVDHSLMGRYGNTLLVNGKTDFSLSMKAGEVKRLYILNSGNTRPFRLSIPGVTMKLVGGDNGYYQKEAKIESLTIAPAERYIIDIMPTKAGKYTLTHIGGVGPVALGTLQVTESTGTSLHASEFTTLTSHNILGNLKDKIPPYLTKSPDKSIILRMSMMGMQGMGNMGMGGGMMGGMNDTDPIEWEDTMSAMNAQSDNKNITWEVTDDATGKKNMDIDWKFTKGTLVKIHIFNDPKSMHAMQHPFHMHGQRFLVLNTNGTVNTDFVWKDTVLVPKGQYVDILVDMSNPGVWMAHCHIVEHLLSGFMFHYTVE